MKDKENVSSLHFSKEDNMGYIVTLALSEFLKIISLMQLIKLVYLNFVFTMHLHVLLTNSMFMIS